MSTTTAIGLPHGVRTGSPPDCAEGENFGATDVGVSPDEISFAATIVKTGIAKDFLADAYFGMEAVIQRTNREGGICGRALRLKYDDDGWDPELGAAIIERYISLQQYFGLAVNPSSQGLRGAIDRGLFARYGFPVVGSLGTFIEQYEDPYVWPVVTSNHSVMHVIAKDAYERGARTFAIVWQDPYPFGVEGHDAFVGAVGRRGGTVVADVKIAGAHSSSTAAVPGFRAACGSNFERCDFIALMLDPARASEWVGAGGLGEAGAREPAAGFGAPTPLLVDSFAKRCGQRCSALRVWSSLKPTVPPFDEDPATTAYIRDLRSVSSAADPANPHVQGAYAGTTLLVNALRRLGTNPTREGLRHLLDDSTWETGLTETLRFRPGDHFGALSARALQPAYEGESFTGWRVVTDLIRDDEVLADRSS